MSRDWRLPAAYDYTKALFRSGWAWEFLRRNPSYAAEPRPVESKLPKPAADDQDETPDDGCRWGLMFRATG